MRPARDGTHARAIGVCDARVDWGPRLRDVPVRAAVDALGEGGEMVEGCVGELMVFVDAVGKNSGVEGWIRSVGEVVCITEAGAPVTEVGGDDENVGGVGDVGGEELAEGGFSGWVGAADHYGNEGWVGRFGLVGIGKLKESVDVGELHLAAMFGFVDGLGHGGKSNVPTLAGFHGQRG